jgi:pimeloyl-ACP methyl ester carboxylesterase
MAFLPSVVVPQVSHESPDGASIARVRHVVRRLFLPGVSGDPEFWRPVAERLPPDGETVRLGWPGLGVQPADPAVASFDDLTARAARALIGPCDVLAQSMGGIVAIRLALRHPDTVRRLVLAATSGGLDVAGLGARDWRPDYRQAFPGAPAWVLNDQPDHSAELHRIAQPTLLLWGDADPISPLAVGRRLAAVLPNARLVVIPGGDHAFVRERAAEVGGPIAEFLGSPD